MLALSVPALAPAFEEAVFDAVITGGKVVDGTGSAWFYGDLGIRGERIARIAPAGALRDAPAKFRVDARGMVVAPGFIDIQGQSRRELLDGDGRLISKITQGITTEILGEGVTNAPANENTAALAADATERKSALRFAGPHGFRRWLAAMEAHGAGLNFGSFVGATTIRLYAKGMVQGAPSPAEVDTMRAAVGEAMEDGAFGLASALIYPPGEYTTTFELAQLARAMQPYSGVYITHLRSEGDRLLEAIDEAIEIGRKGGIPVEIYHLKAAGVRNWPRMRDAIAKVNDARRAGVDVSADMYPYVAGGTGLTACLPPWASAEGKLFENLSNPAMRQRIRSEALHEGATWENLCELATPQGVLIAQLVKPENQRFAGKRLSEIAAIEKKDWIDAAMDLILSERRRVETMFFVASEDNLKLQIEQPWIKFGTDAPGLDPATGKQLAHPRAYGNFPRVLGKYVREEKVMPLEEAVRKMTSAVANRLSIRDRGVIREGLFADLVVFNPRTIADRATYEQPHQVSAGVGDVFVNGVPVVRNGMVTGALPGKALYGPGRGLHPFEKPPAASERWTGLIGEYGADSGLVIVLEKSGRLVALVDQHYEYPVEERDFSSAGVRIAGVLYPRRPDPAQPGATFRITPLKPLEELRAEASRAKPPVEIGEFRPPDLVEVARLDTGVRLDIRYASANNFMGTPFYAQARAFLQRPAAEAVMRANRWLRAQGYGLLIHDAYRPWSVTKMFWEATPPDKRIFVADPSQGSRHNRGCAVDLTLCDLRTGEPVQMTGGYDEMSARSYPDYPGGTSLERWHRDLLRRAMEREGFQVFEFEWWHFDYEDWPKYPILNVAFEELP